MKQLFLVGAAALILVSLLPDVASAQRGRGGIGIGGVLVNEHAHPFVVYGEPAIDRTVHWHRETEFIFRQGAALSHGVSFYDEVSRC